MGGKMVSLQYVIDSICSSLTVKFVYELIEAHLKEGPFTVGEILPLIQSKDRSLDLGSAKMLAQAALGELAQRGSLRIEGDYIYLAT